MESVAETSCSAREIDGWGLYLNFVWVGGIFSEGLGLGLSIVGFDGEIPWVFQGIVGLWMVIDNEAQDEIEMTGRVMGVKFFW